MHFASGNDMCKTLSYNHGQEDEVKHLKQIKTAEFRFLTWIFVLTFALKCPSFGTLPEAFSRILNSSVESARHLS